MHKLIFASLLAVPLAAASAPGAPITFETTPAGAVPTDDSSLTAPYTFAGGSVRFYFDADNNGTYQPGVDMAPKFERAGGIVGEAESGFRSTLSSVPLDTARTPAAAQLGNWFLRKPGDIDTATPTPFVFVAEYSTAAPIRALSGEIWDIDASAGTERWRVDVLSASNAVLATSRSPEGISQNDPASLDGLPWTFVFSGLPDGVSKLRLTFVGTKESGVGLAFNNFSPDTVPEPGTAGLLAAATAGPLFRRRRQR